MQEKSTFKEHKCARNFLPCAFIMISFSKLFHGYGNLLADAVLRNRVNCRLPFCFRFDHTLFRHCRDGLIHHDIADLFAMQLILPFLR